MLKLIPLALILTTLIPFFFPSVNEVQYMTFKQYAKLYNLHFQTKFQERYREAIYNANVILIQAHNSLKNVTYKMGVNQFTYLTQEEFISFNLGYVPSEQNRANVDPTYIVSEQLDWVSKGAVTGIKNQGNCGSCWAFSTTGAIEGISKLNYGNLQSFSEQQLIDCSLSYGNNGCNGGNMENSMRYIAHNGITTQSMYPYKGTRGNCIYNQGSFKISGYFGISGCPAVINALMSKPISASVDATNWASYKSGIFQGCGFMLNHGVLIVGIKDEYWKIKNSWGTTWGENGYMRLARGNTCGVCNHASFPMK